MMVVVVHKVNEGLPLNTHAGRILFQIVPEIIFLFLGIKSLTPAYRSFHISIRLLKAWLSALSRNEGINLEYAKGMNFISNLRNGGILFFWE
jgi:hypothetical protein